MRVVGGGSGGTFGKEARVARALGALLAAASLELDEVELVAVRLLLEYVPAEVLRELLVHHLARRQLGTNRTLYSSFVNILKV